MDSQIHQAIRTAFCNDDASAMRQLLGEYPAVKALINEPIGPFDSPAITNVRSREMLDTLLEAGADINARSRWWAGGFGLLDSASPKLAEYAIERGAKLGAHSAARLGYLDKLRELVEAEPGVVHARGGDGQTPLHFAGSVEIAAFLLEKGARIDEKDIDHEATPAQWMLDGRREVAAYLVERGCKSDILMAVALGNAALVERHLNDNPEAIRTSVSERHFPMKNPRAGGHIYIWTIGRYKTPLSLARELGHTRLREILLNRAPVDLRFIDASEGGDKESVEQLLLANPDLVSSLAEEQQQRLSFAAQENNTKAVRLMVGAGWPLDVRGQHGGTALHWAAFNGNPDVMKVLLPGKPRLEIKDFDFNATPLGWALYGSTVHSDPKKDYLGCVKLLLEAGACLPDKPNASKEVLEYLKARAIKSS